MNLKSLKLQDKNHYRLSWKYNILKIMNNKWIAKITL